MRVLHWLGLVVALGGCAGRDTHSETPESATRRALGGAANRTSQQAAESRALPSRELVVVPGGTFGPYVGRSSSSGVLVWASRNTGKAEWHSLGIGLPEGTASSPVTLGPAPEQLSLVVVREARPQGGFVVLSAEPNGQDSVVHAMLLGSEGQLESGPFELAQTQGPLLWLDALPGEEGPLVFWAVGARGLAELHAARLDGERKAHTVSTDALAWQLAPFDKGAALATVTQNGVKRDVLVSFVDDKGQSKGKPLHLRTRSLAQLDLDMANLGGSLVAAWSEESHLEPTLFAAAIDSSGSISQPAKRLTAPMGEQALVRIVPPAPGQKQGYVLWENLNQAARKSRRLELAPLLPNATLGEARATLQMHGEAATLPEFAASKTGLAALTQAPLCLKPPEPCDAAETFPAYVEFDKKLEVIASEPLRLSDTGGAGIDLAWGLGCGDAGCSALAAPKSGPAPIYWVKLMSVSDVFLRAAHKYDQTQRPSLGANEAWQELDPLADLAALPGADAELVSWITYFDPTLPYERPKAPAPDGRFAPVRALLQTLHTGKLDSEPTSISIRARSLGGVAMDRGANNDALLGWTAIDNQLPQVFVTLVNAQGQRKQLSMLTRTPGEKSDVALARLADGWAVAWVDEREPDPEVYSVKIGNNLAIVAPEQRLTERQGGASDLTLLALGERVLAVWGDTRGARQQGHADIYTRLLAAKDLAPQAAEVALEKSPGHSHSVRVAQRGSSLLAAWIEDGHDGAGPRVRFVALDAEGKPKGDVRSIDVAATSLTGLALECREEQCHLVFGGNANGQAILWATRLAPDQSLSTRELTTLTGSPTQQTMPVLAGGVVFVAVQSEQGQTRLRRLHVHWE